MDVACIPQLMATRSSPVLMWPAHQTHARFDLKCLIKSVTQQADAYWSRGLFGRPDMCYWAVPYVSLGVTSCSTPCHWATDCFKIKCTCRARHDVRCSIAHWMQQWHCPVHYRPLNATVALSGALSPTECNSGTVRCNIAHWMQQWHCPVQYRPLNATVALSGALSPTECNSGTARLQLILWWSSEI